MEVGL